MKKKAPSHADFPSHLTLTITPPPTPQPPPATETPPEIAQPNILILLHGLGDSAIAFTSFARALNLPETTILTIQAPHPLPFDLPGAHWGDDLTFDTSGGPGSGAGSGMDMDGGFVRATRVLLDEVIVEVLLRKCGYTLSEILVFGFGQGGMVGLCLARQLSLSSGTGDSPGDLSGVVSIGAPFPLSATTTTTTTGRKCRTPVLLVAGRDASAVSDSSVLRTKEVFEFVETHRYARRGDGMPRSRDEMLPVMRFFARRLRSWRGVPPGSVEIT